MTVARAVLPLARARAPSIRALNGALPWFADLRVFRWPSDSALDSSFDGCSLRDYTHRGGTPAGIPAEERLD